MDMLTDEDFRKLGFDVTSEPFTKQVVDGIAIVYKNYVRDGSGRYDGYILVRPEAKIIKTLDDFLTR